MIELLCTDYNKKATSIHYYFGNAVLAVYDGYTVLGNPKSIDDHYLITPEQYAEDGAVTTEAVYGRVALLTLFQPREAARVEKNTADIDYVAIMAGIDL